ncbi:MAG: lysylphosphatidylglycerol synthase transmembrane domain-containing protein [Fibrobacteraceae bacterium]|nr:lysylphosphatidylglycerol synthase transmembrane domain-containing protein [Fibrobacteraceae bacterium]
MIFLLKIVVTIALAYIVFRNIANTPGFDSNDLEKVLSQIKVWPLFVALLCLLVSNLTGCLQWKTLLKTQGVRLSYFHVLRLYFVGLFFNNFMPGNVGGDVKKVYDIRVQGGVDSVGAGLTATFFDRLFGFFFLTLLALGVGSLFFIHDPEQRAFIIPSLWVFLGFCVLFAAIFSRRIGESLAKLLALIFPENINTRVLRMLERFRSFRIWNLWGKLFVLSTITQVLRVLVHYFCGIALGLDIAVSWYFFYIPLVALVSALPISIGGFGPRELLAQSLFAKAGVPVLESVIVQLLAYLAGLVISLFGAIFFVLDNGKKNKEAK